MKLDALYQQYASGKISKHEYIEAMYNEHHATLFDYAKYIEKTDIALIEIRNGKVVMASREYGLRMVCPEGDRRVAPVESLNFLRYEPDESDMLVSLLPRSGHILDIGANLGWYTLLMAKVRPLCVVHAFEPVEDTFKLLNTNVELNPFSNIILHPYGFSDSEGVHEIYVDEFQSVRASLRQLEDCRGSVTCSFRLLDTFAEDYLDRSIKFIKCDVEGAELLVFKGARNLLEKHRPIIYTEMLRKWSARFGYNPNDIIGFLSDFEYQCYTVNGGRLRQLLTMLDDTPDTNFFFLCPDRHSNEIERYEMSS